MDSIDSALDPLSSGSINVSGIVTESDASPPRGNPFAVVGIGASAGGLEAFGQLLNALPDNTGMAFVLVQHLDPAHESQLVDLLAPSCSMPLETVYDGMPIAPDTVYVMPPNVSMVLEDGHLRLFPRESGLHLPIDIFFRSLATVQGSRAIGVVLSGNASDGSLGLRAIKTECGITFAQEESSARFGGMPRNAVSTGAVDFILSPQDIGRELTLLGHHPYLLPSEPGISTSETLPEGDKEFRALFSILNNATKVDFSTYKLTTVRRRIGRRMMVLRLQSLSDYVQHVEKHPAEVAELYRDLLISVTSFFRDTNVFGSLERLLQAEFADRKPREGSFRVWVAGCATGEEVYSLAICLYEILAESHQNIPVQIFGTDIHESALERARQGMYAENIAEDVSAERLKKFFLKTDSGYQISKPIRESCIFARHDVTRDPPFSNLDLVSCRNLLIYLDATQQRRVLPVFHYGLKPGGILVLGTAESISTAEDLFTPVNKQVQIYRRKAAPVRLPVNIDLIPGPPPSQPMDRRGAPISMLDLQRKIDRLIQSRYSPDAVVINSELQIVQFRGHTNRYLSPGSGEASLNLLRMAHESLVVPLRRAIQAAVQRNISVEEFATLAGQDTSDPVDLRIEITPISGSTLSEHYYLVIFHPVKPEAASSAEAGSATSFNDERLKRLHQELTETRGYLRTLTEEYEAYAEELRAANEEARSANEELQSTNEELGTTKEELQSTNEELTTVNEELNSRNYELSATNGDLKNLLGAVSLAIVMVDQDLRVRRFNPAAEKLIELSPLDIGRPVGHLRGQVEIPRLEDQVRLVIETLHPLTEEVQARDGVWYSFSIRPYRTMENHIAGAVITIQDINALKRGLKAAEEARDYAEGMIKTVREPLVVLDSDLRVQRATNAFYETFLVTREETEGRLLYDLGNGQWNQPRLRELLGAALFRQEPFHDYEVQHEFPHIGRRTMSLNAQRIPLPDNMPRVLLLAIEDTTRRRELAEIRYQRLFETAKDGIVVLNAETGMITDINPYMLSLTGHRLDDFIGKSIDQAKSFQSMQDLASMISNLNGESILRLSDQSLQHQDGSAVSVDIVGNRYFVGTQPVVQLNVRDNSARKQAARELHESEQRFRLFVESVQDYTLFQMDPDGNIDTWTSGAERQFGWTEAEAVGRHGSLIFTPEDIAKGEAAKELEEAREHGRAEDERWHIRKNGSRFFASGVLTRVNDENGRIRGFAKIMRDVTERRAVEQRLKQQAALLDLAHDAILVRHLDGRILFWNRGAESLYGWSAEEAVGKISHTLFRAEYPDSLSIVNAKLVSDGHWDGISKHRHQNGSVMFVSSRWALQPGEGEQRSRVLEINVDITASKEQEEGLQRSLEEKSMLVREIHHRVKNNLQVIVSLLSLQSSYIKDPQIVAAFEETESRVRAIAQIHERLYASDDLTEVEFAGYLTHLTQELVALYATADYPVSLSLSVQEMVLHIEKAIPLGLVANELIINSLKHGLHKRAGKLEVSLTYEADRVRADLGQTLDDGWAQVRIKDSGPGLPKGIDFSGAHSLGFRLVTLLVRQLRGNLRVLDGDGADIIVEFPLGETSE